jgi:hypothetical protein
MTARVSVLIKCYNYGRFLPQCLRSVISQSRPPEGIILVDDGSTDETTEIARGFPQVRYFRQRNAGCAAASNRAFKESRGDILCHLDASVMRQGLVCNWKHLALPLMCLLPIRRTSTQRLRPSPDTRKADE